jgi:hypothetical protein
MPLSLLKYNPGIVKDITEYAAGKNGPFWVDGDLIRFKNGYPEKIGGWEKEQINALGTSGSITSTETTITGIARRMLFWRAFTDGEDRLAVGTHNHLYIVENGGLFDITPLRKTTSNLTNPLVVTSGSTTVTVTDNSHGAKDGDWIVINSATTTGGIEADDLNRMSGYQITLLATDSTNKYTFVAPSAATGNATGGGTTIDIKYLIGFTAGLGTQSSDPALGWGVGPWGGVGIGGDAGTTNDGEIVIGTEIIKYTGISTNTLTGCTRGFDTTVIATTITADINASVTTIPLASVAGLGLTGTIKIDDEIITYTGISGSSLTGCARPAVGTSSAATHSNGAAVTTTSAIKHDNGATVTLRHFGLTTTLAEALDGIETEIDLTSATNFSGTNVMGFGTVADISVADVALENSSWNLNLWGEDLIATVRNGAIYYFDTSTGSSTRAVLVSSLGSANSVPSVARTSIVSFPDRHFIAGGCQAYATGGGGNVDEMLVRWSNQEDFTNFQPTTTNTAGDQRLQIGIKIVAMVAAREETIISTDAAIYGMTFVGAPFIFSFRLLGTDCGAAGLNTMIGIDGDVMWMGKRNFFRYDGVLQELPCSVQYYVFDRMQTRYIDKVVVGHNKKFKEIIWFYVSNDNTAGTVNPEPDSYVSYNYAENAWSIGSMDRTVWNDSFGARSVPFAFDPDGYLYNQETGTSNNGVAMTSYIEGAPRELTQDGSDLYMVDKIVPNATMTTDTQLSLYINTRKYPNSPETTKGPFTIEPSTEKISTRAKGRQIALKFESTGTDDAWTLGDFRVNVRPDGPR